MKSPLIYLHSGLSFAKAFAGRLDPVVEKTAHGLSRLDGWNEIPETRALRAAAEGSPALPARCLLYCYEGPHTGECFPVRSPRTTVGVRAEDGIVLTPSRESQAARFEFSVGEGVELIGAAPHPFELNGRAEYRATLVDYDEVTRRLPAGVELAYDGLEFDI